MQIWMYYINLIIIENNSCYIYDLHERKNSIIVWCKIYIFISLSIFFKNFVGANLIFSIILIPLNNYLFDLAKEVLWKWRVTLDKEKKTFVVQLKIFVNK